MFKKRPLACAALFVCLGSLTAYLFYSGGMRDLARIPLFLLAAALLPALLSIKKTGFLLSVIISSLLLGYVSQALYDRRIFSDVLSLDGGRIHQIEARVTDLDTEDERTLTVSIRSIDQKKASGSVLLTLNDPEFLPKENEIIACRIMILERGDTYLYRQGIAARAVTAKAPHVIGKEDEGIGDRISDWNALLCNRLRRGMDEDGASMLSAILLGNREALAPSVAKDFRRTGLSHMLALSGLHLSILALMILSFLRKLGAPRPISFLTLVLFVSFYTAIAGFPLSLLRAAGMLILAELGRLLRLSSDSITSLFTSVSIIILLTPGAVADVGLALSFLATLGILTAFGMMPKKEGHISYSRRMMKRLLFGLIATLAATMFTLLLSVLVFGEISLISPISNLVVSPLLHILLLLGPFGLAFPRILSPIVSFFSGITLKIVSFLSNIPWIYIEASYPIFIFAAILFSGMLVFLLLDDRIGKKAFGYCVFAGFFVLILTLTVCHTYTASRDYALYKRTAGSEFMLFQTDRAVTVVDNGGNAYAADVIKATLQKNHITRIDTLIITRYTKQTAALIAALTDKLYVDSILLSPGNSEYALRAKEAAVSAEVDLVNGENGTHTLEGDLALTLRGNIRLSETANGFFMRLAYREKRVCYAPAHALSVVDPHAIESFTDDADLVVVGAEPSFSGVFSGKGLDPDATLVIGNIQNAEQSVIDRENTVVEPKEFRITLK